MIALTRDFHVFASCVTTGFSAIFFSVRYIAQARDVCALLGFVICHYDSVLFTFVLQSLCSPVPQACHSRPLVWSTNLSKFAGTLARWLRFGAHDISTNCIRISKLTSWLARVFRVLRQAVKPREISGVDGPIGSQYLDGVDVVSLLVEVQF